MRSRSPKFALLPCLFAVGLTAVASGLLNGCASSRTDALQQRQDRMNDRTEERAERRAIRSENMDARNQALFDAM